MEGRGWRVVWALAVAGAAGVLVVGMLVLLPASAGRVRAQELLAAAGGAEVAVQGLSFVPQTVEIFAGEVVTWSNAGGFHNVAADDDSFRSGDPAGSFVFSHTFPVAGTYPYRCEVHAASGMTGTVVVRQALVPQLYLPWLGNPADE